MNIWVFQHVRYEPPAAIRDVLEERGFQLRIFHPSKSEGLPRDLSGCNGLVVMGGPMGVYEVEAHPWMAEEIGLLRLAVARNIPAMGICLGAQMLAAAGGGRVYPGPSCEMGWCQLSLTEEGLQDPLTRQLTGHPEDPDSETTVFQWHGDTFDLPQAAVLLASSPMYPHQAFRLGRAYGFQFHFEVDEGIIKDWVKRDTHMIQKSDTTPQATLDAIAANLPGVAAHGKALVHAFADLIQQ